jgi:hypothetical protein|tara:strand:- start:863 stop:1414 length:552 start_codon:yes stop_codon:yes gene_type:complete
MKSIKNVKLGIVPKSMEVSVNSDVIMNSKDDFDDLYVVMFNIMDDPLRLSLITIGNLSGILKDRGLTTEQIKNLYDNNPEKYLSESLNNPESFDNYATENIRIVLDNPEDAQKARLLISSMIQNKQYLQKTNYIFPNESVEKEQAVDTTELIPQLKIMLEIIKQWETFDIKQFSQSLSGANIK